MCPFLELKLTKNFPISLCYPIYHDEYDELNAPVRFFSFIFGFTLLLENFDKFVLKKYMLLSLSLSLYF